jgi:hypothetical protein
MTAEQPRFFESAVANFKASPRLPRYGFGSDIILVPRGREHHDLIVFSKAAWKLPCIDARENFTGVYIHFECERPHLLLLHCELYPRQGSETRHDRGAITPLLELKGGIANLIREAAARDGWSQRLGWVSADRDLTEPRNLQVGKFELPEGADATPDDFVRAIERIVEVVVPSVDAILANCVTEPPCAS